MIVVNLCGGLGNQMFQYAFARRLACDRHETLRFDVRDMQNDPLRKFALNGFRVAGSIVAGAELVPLLPWQRHLAPRVRNMLARLPSGVRYLRERSFSFDAQALVGQCPVYVEGYWQSELYFAPRADVIRADFTLASPMTLFRRAIAERIAAAGNGAVSVHVRRGDYVSNPAANAYHGTCEPQWYAAAMERMVEGLAAPTFFVFSDDPAWARDNLPDRWRYEFVAPQDDGRDFEDMHLMAMCRHHIIANSSFSWWGAWLDRHPDKRVIAPARWFKGAGHDTRDLIPEAWERL